jgi:hypothetical protein
LSRGAPLTSDEIEAARILREQGLSWRDIAWRLNRDQRGLNRAVSKQGLIPNILATTHFSAHQNGPIK